MTAFGLLFGPDGWGLLLLQGTLVTLGLALTTVPLGFGTGLLLAIGRTSGWRFARAFAEAYATFFRGIPDLVALFIVYFGLQAVLDWLGQALGMPRIELHAFQAGVIALSVVVAAYSSEVWMAALWSVPAGQGEAARSLGLDRKRAFLLVELPQLARVALPGLGNIWTVLLKDTSLISTLAVTDLLRAASEASKSTTRPLLFYSAAAAVYLVISIASGLGQAAPERQANRGIA